MATETEIVQSKAVQGEVILDRWISLDGPAISLSFADGRWFYETETTLNAGFDIDVIDEIDRIFDHWSRETTKVDSYTQISGPGTALEI
jgi:hypothetical protein